MEPKHPLDRPNRRHFRIKLEGKYRSVLNLNSTALANVQAALLRERFPGLTELDADGLVIQWVDELDALADRHLSTAQVRALVLECIGVGTDQDYVRVEKLRKVFTDGGVNMYPKTKIEYGCAP